MVKEWQQNISEIKQTIKELISHNKTPIVRTTKEKKTEEGSNKRRRNALPTPPGLQYKSSEW